DLLTNALGVDEALITYKEHPWIGGGNAGPSLEVVVAGLELATLVFMNLKKDKHGTVDLDGDRYSPLALNVVDTGYGLERFVWASQGTPTIFESIFPGMLQEIVEISGLAAELNSPRIKKILSEHALLAGILDLSDGSSLRSLRTNISQRLAKKGVDVSAKELESIFNPLEAVYTITDHSKTIALMLSDGIVPSNVKAGYLTRLLIRRTLRMMEERGIDEPLTGFVLKQLDYWKGIMDTSSKDVVKEIMELEEERYRATVEKGRGMVQRHLRKGSISHDDLVSFYDSHGLHPSLVRAIGADMGTEVDVPDNFDTLLADKHQQMDMGEEKEERVYDLPPTQRLYYEEEEDVNHVETTIIHSQGNEVVLDRTPFYPDGGGQPADHGVLETEDAAVLVLDVQRYGDVIVHTLKHPIPNGTKVVAHVEWTRRMGHTRHHTATHILIGICREVLGKHIWQSGSQNQETWGRIDLSHFRGITREEIRRIEHLANTKVQESILLSKEEKAREEAEKEHGFQLYQGGAPKATRIRVVCIPGLDSEACGGTHVHSTAEVGLIKILGTERIQDGVVRITFSAGPAALDAVQRQEDLLFESSKILSIPPDQLPRTVQRFFDEWKERGKEVEKLSKYEAMALSAEYEKKIEGGMLVRSVPPGVDVIILARALVEEQGRKVFLVSEDKGNKCALARSSDIDLDCGQMLREVLKGFGKGGGGRPDFAQGGGVEDTKALVEKMKEMLG
ncbi:MAG: alanine--tRNA ligase, partial [Thermoplasmata archaeon]|nr:alanine--tRNA ligase [Thermoplasmata archaeon]